MLTNVDPLLIAVILATTVVGYFINKQLSGYSYRHRDEEGEIENKLEYSAKLTQKQGISKDIRIFNMRPWLEELYTKALDAYTSFKKRESNVVIWGSIADLVLTFLRGGVAYFYLINMVIGGGLRRITVPSVLLHSRRIHCMGKRHSRRIYNTSQTVSRYFLSARVYRISGAVQVRRRKAA